MSDRDTLGLINKQLSEENTILCKEVDSLREENEFLKLQLRKYGDGKVYPREEIDSLTLIAQLRTHLKRLQIRLSKYESESVTEKHEGIKYSSIQKMNNDLQIVTDDDAYLPQPTREISSAALVPAGSSDGYFMIIKKCLKSGKEMIRRDIINQTGLTEKQFYATVEKNKKYLSVRVDPTNKRRNLYKLK